MKTSDQGLCHYHFWKTSQMISLKTIELEAVGLRWFTRQGKSQLPLIDPRTQVDVDKASCYLRGKLENTVIAVKKLSERLDISDDKFKDEIGCLMKVKHQNIVRLLGYCANIQGEMVGYNGDFVMADVRQRLLCFEYVSKGNLDEYMKDASCGLDWIKSYQIIKGFCEGLHHLYQNHIVHLDLKPANILLDDSMVLKITDFGLSRCFDEKQSRAITKNMAGTWEYMPPVFHSGDICIITYKSDDRKKVVA